MQTSARIITPPGALYGGESLAAFRQRVPGGTVLLYPAGMATANSTTTAVTFNNIAAVPYPSPFACTLDVIQFEVTTVAASSFARCGIYQATSRNNIYPSALVVDGGEFDTSATGGTGLKGTTISVSLAADTLYWFVYLAKTASPTIRAIPAVNCSVIGFPSAMGASSAYVGLLGSLTYAALPATFPASIGGTQNAQPMIWARVQSAAPAYN